MKKKFFIIFLCAFLLSTPTILAFPIINKPLPLFSPIKISSGTFAGGFGHGHWQNGFHIDTILAYMNGVYTSGTYIKMSGEIINPDDKKIGEISAFIFSKFIFGFTRNMQGQYAPIFVFLNENRNNQFIGRIIFSTFTNAPHIWGYLIPNT